MARLPDGWINRPVMKDIKTIEVKQEELITCKNCEYCVVKDWWGDFGGMPVLASSNVPTCTKWGSGDCMTRLDGYCFMAKKKEEKNNEHCESER